MRTYAAPPAPPAPAPPAGEVRRRIWAWAKVLGGLAILAVLLWRLGSHGFRDGLRAIDAGTLLAAVGIGGLTTVVSAWRWRLVARGLGISLPLPVAVADYYQALFLNAALPGGILGDVHRAARHGRNVGDLGLGVRSVVLERSAGQVVLVAVGVAVLFALPSPARSAGQLFAVSPVLAAALAAAGLAVAVLAAFRLRRATSRWARALRTGASAVRRGLLARRIWPGIVVSSTVVLAGYLATFLVAARAVGSTAPASQLVPLMVLALFGMALPVNVGGWGPREGVCAWAFGAAGLGATQGLAIAVVYGVAVFAAALPGAGVLLVRWITQRGRPGLRRAPRSRNQLDQGRPVGAGWGLVPNRSESA